MWNGRKATPYEEPVELVDATMEMLGWGLREREAVERQRQRFLRISVPATSPTPAAKIAEFPAGPFRFVALDVETASNDRASICQIGLAGVRADNSIQAWKTYVNPRTDNWSCSWVHGITARDVAGAPAFAAAWSRIGQPAPGWNWRDSVELARRAWPELRGNSGHGLASLKQYLDLQFAHHDAGEDARACAEVVLRAEEELMLRAQESRADSSPSVTREQVKPKVAEARPIDFEGDGKRGRLLGTTEITDGDIRKNHIYLRPFFKKFPADAIGGSNAASAARREVTVHWRA
jgi:DNA polymerase-3 subunit epsilon